MNAASSLGLPAMEDPFADSMEMASPYTGQVDDFEIDIDIMEDQPSNVDNDFDLQDASPDGASADQPHDADMMDDVPEMTVTDASTYNNDGSMQYTDTNFFTAQEPVESEMIDEEYEANNETAPSTFEALTAQQNEVNFTETVEPVNDQQVKEEESKDVEEQNVEEAVEETKSLVQETIDQESTRDELDEPKVDAAPTVTEGQVESVTEYHPENRAEINEVVEGTNEVPTDVAVIEPGVEDELAGEPGDVKNRGLDDSPPAGPTHQAVENEHDFTEQHTPYIHPVKVIYQESEISMFPPRHGDTSETYFLANEGLAHENIDNLFKECRTILGDHASSEDSLVFHIDPLGIELSEDNTHVCKVTLSQIVDTYLHLCRNDGIEQPEPLYLTLNTRAHLSSELAALLNAAKEGKGISDIQNWEEEYEHEGIEDAGVSSRADLPEQNLEEDEGDQQVDHEEKEPQQHEGLDSELAESHQESREDIQHDARDGLVETEEAQEAAEQTGIDSADVQEHHDKEDSGEIDYEGQELTESHSHLQSHDDFEQTEPLHTLDNEPIPESEYQQQEQSTMIGPDVTVAGDTDFAGDENQDYSATDDAVVPDSHVKREVQVEHDSAESKVAAGERTDASEVATAAEQHNETGGYEDEEETPGQESIEEEEGEYYEDAGEEHYEEYAEEEYHEEPVVGAQDTEELLIPQEGHNDDSYVADQFDQASSKTVSASNEPVDKNDDMPDNLQTGVKTDATEGHDYAQEIPDFPDLPEDDLLGLDDDIFADTEQASHRETEDGNGVDASHIDQGHDASVEQETAADGDVQNIELKRQGSTIGKRSRADDEEEIDFDGMPSPGTKRTRSS